MSDRRLNNPYSHTLDNLIEQVKAQNDIVDVVRERISLDQNFQARCPFHIDTHPSLSVKPEGQFFRCFGCGASGDVISFIQRINDISFLEALKGLARRAGIPFPRENDGDFLRFEEERKIQGVLTEAANLYHRNLTPEARGYLIRERKFSGETISRFILGYSNGGLEHYLVEERGFPLDLCIKAGVLCSTDGQTRDFFLDRVIFPNIRHGRVVYMIGRSLEGREPKYLNLPGGIKFLFNEDSLSNQEVIVTEGAADCIMAVQNGFPAVALLGTSLKPDFYRKFSRCEKVFLCMDGDSAGRKATEELGEAFREMATVVELPEGCDLNDYLTNHTRDEFEGLLRGGKDFISYKLSLIPEDTPKTELPDRLAFIIKMLATMVKPKAEAYLTEHIKQRFDLGNKDVEAYRAVITGVRNSENQHKPVHFTREPEQEFKAYFDGLVDLVEQDGKPSFLVREGDEFRIVSEVDTDSSVIIPPPRDQIPWFLPRGEECVRHIQIAQSGGPVGIDAALYDDLREYFESVSELPGQDYYDLLVAWVMHTYLMEQFEYTPYLCLFAVPERGKTRTGKAIIYTAYRGIHIESLREADLIRFADRFKGSVFFDVKDIWAKAERAGSEDILLQRYERGAVVRRVNYPDRGPFRDTDTYSVFGPTLISTNTGAHRILETRSVLITMPQTTRRFENDVTPRGALELKERLVSFRALHLGRSLPEIPKPAPDRLGDILKPLLQTILLVRPDREQSFRNLIVKLLQERKLDKAESFEAEVVRVVSESETDVTHGVFPVKAVTNKLNDNLPERNKVTPHRVGRVLKSLGFSSGRVGNNHGYRWDPVLILRLKGTYGLNETDESHETHETHQQ